MSFGHSTPQASLQLSQGFPRSALREERGVNLLRGMRACTADDYTFAILFPLED
jgi:hypothetical protein